MGVDQQNKNFKLQYGLGIVKKNNYLTLQYGVEFTQSYQ